MRLAENACSRISETCRPPHTAPRRAACTGSGLTAPCPQPSSLSVVIMSTEIAPGRTNRRFQRAVHRAAHATRMGWYGGLYRLSRGLTTPTPAAPAVAERMPSAEQLRAGLNTLIEQDLANI